MPALAEMLTAIRELAGSLDGRIADRVARAEVAERLREEEEDVERALGLAQGLVLEARADDGLATPGQSVGVAVALFNNAGRGSKWRRSNSRLPPAGRSTGSRARRARSRARGRTARASR